MFSRHLLIFFAVVLAVAIVNAAPKPDIDSDTILQINNTKVTIRQAFGPMSRDCATKAAVKCLQYWLNREKMIECAGNYFKNENPTCLSH